ncbi:MAG TPA: hypothetical protein VK663_00025 [Burkholderiales bacterium]|nr:hypothetical protein [Burkholderiales bacterium]
MKPTETDRIVTSHYYFTRHLPHGALPLREISFRQREPDANRGDRVVGAVATVIILCGLIGCVVEYFSTKL